MPASRPHSNDAPEWIKQHIERWGRFGHATVRSLFPEFAGAGASSTVALEAPRTCESL